MADGTASRRSTTDATSMLTMSGGSSMSDGSSTGRTRAGAIAVLDPVDLLAVRQHGVVSRWQMRALGLSSAAVRSRADARVWTTVTDEVLVRVGSHPGPAQRAMAAVLDAGPGAVLSFQSGAAWYRVAGAQMSTVHTLSTVHSRRRSVLSDVHIVRVVPAPRVTVLDGIPIARPELIALHLFASEPPARAERWVERMWSMRLLSGASIARFLSAMGRRGRNGTAGLRRYLDARPADYTPSATGLELRARDVLLLAGFDVRAQVSSGGDVWTGRVDLRDAAHPVILEVQSAMYHDALVDREADAKRLAQLRADGFVVVEVTDTIVFHDTDELVRRYREGVKEAERRSGLRLVPPTCSVAQNRGEPRGSAQQERGWWWNRGGRSGPCRVAFRP